jgi:tight adherence protein C
MTGLAMVLGLGALWGLLLADVADRALWRLAVRRPSVVAAPSGPAGDVAASRLALHWPVGPLAWWLSGRTPSSASAPPLAWLRSRRERRREVDVVEQLPDVVDLLRLTTHAGLPVSGAVAAIGDRPGGPVGAAFRDAATRSARGLPTAEVLPLVARMCGPPGRSLIDALLDHDRYGTPLGPALDRVAVEVRILRRRRAEEAARRLPVLLLFPLVLTILPAFVLLAVVPLLVGAFSSLSL